jgi:hypothetical protein
MGSLAMASPPLDIKMSSSRATGVVGAHDQEATLAPAVHTQAGTKQQSNGAGRALMKGAGHCIALNKQHSGGLPIQRGEKETTTHTVSPVICLTRLVHRHAGYLATEF